MNEIKFRVYDKEEKCYLSDFDLENLLMDMYGKLSWYTIDPHGAGNEIDFPNLIIEQFIGLKDKNGVDIHNNDVCHIKTEKDIDELDFLKWDTKIIVSRSRNKFVALDFDTKKETEYLEMSFIENIIEVIGNLHKE